jgi:hypothetical protein
MADFMAVYGLSEAAAIVQIVMISEQLLMISAGNFATNGSISVHCWGWGGQLRIAVPLFETTGLDFR